MCLFLFSSVIHGLILPALVTHERRISLLNLIFPISPAPDQVLQLCQHIRIAVSSPTVGLKHLLLPGLLPPTSPLFTAFTTELIKSRSLLCAWVWSLYLFCSPRVIC